VGSTTSIPINRSVHGEEEGRGKRKEAWSEMGRDMRRRDERGGGRR
jgi:hypothetical protein